MYCDKRCSYSTEAVFYRQPNPENNPYTISHGADIYADMIISRNQDKDFKHNI